MKSKKLLGLFAIIFLIIIFYIAFYNKIYRINISNKNVYEIQISTLDPYHTEIITKEEDINKYLDKIHELRYTHPKYCSEKGWSTNVTIKIENDNGTKTQFRYWLVNNYITIGTLRYKIVLN